MTPIRKDAPIDNRELPVLEARTARFNAVNTWVLHHDFTVGGRRLPGAPDRARENHR